MKARDFTGAVMAIVTAAATPSTCPASELVLSSAARTAFAPAITASPVAGPATRSVTVDVDGGGQPDRLTLGASIEILYGGDGALDIVGDDERGAPLGLAAAEHRVQDLLLARSMADVEVIQGDTETFASEPVGPGLTLCGRLPGCPGVAQDGRVCRRAGEPRRLGVHAEACANEAAAAAMRGRRSTIRSGSRSCADGGSADAG